MRTFFALLAAVATTAALTVTAVAQPPAETGTLRLISTDPAADVFFAVDGQDCDGLPAEVAAEIARLDPSGVIALGGPEAVCDATLTAAGG